ncbi:hypothetical protein DFP86_109180 [Paludibacterium purpuratum]|uniref:Uncharacterized protein n=1 Tax=Paludibacterium purpuratum TaxID=1144873 RepID=A0A4R7B4Z8_9NEIS|nr:hypothetical protein DFP86_109180 [Paludibacterium purpuratum]
MQETRLGVSRSRDMPLLAVQNKTACHVGDRRFVERVQSAVWDGFFDNEALAFLDMIQEHQQPFE